MPQHCLQMDCSSTVLLSAHCTQSCPLSPHASAQCPTGWWYPHSRVSQQPQQQLQGCSLHLSAQQIQPMGLHPTTSIALHRQCTGAADKLHGTWGSQHGGRGEEEGEAGPVAAHLLPFNAQSLQPQDLSTAVQHHTPTHSPEPTELQPPAGPASPPHRQCVITPLLPPIPSGCVLSSI